MTLGVVFDRLAACYRSRPLLFSGIVLPTAAAGILIDVFSLAFGPESLSIEGGDLRPLVTFLVALLPGFIVGVLLMVILSTLALAATVTAVGSMNRGERITLTGAYTAAAARSLTLVPLGLALAAFALFYFCMSALFSMVGGAVLGQLHPAAGIVFALCAGLAGLAGSLPLVAVFGMAIPLAAGAEPGEVWVTGAIMRSIDLTRGHRLMVLLVYLLTWVLAGVVAFMFQFPFLLARSVLDLSGGWALLVNAGSVTVSALAHLIAAPIPLVAVAVLYHGLMEATVKED